MRGRCFVLDYVWAWGLLVQNVSVAKAGVVVKPVEVKTEKKIGRFSDI